MGKDTVGLVPTNSTSSDQLSATGFDFFLITSQTGLDGLDGILGLSPALAEDGPSFVSALYN